MTVDQLVEALQPHVRAGVLARASTHEYAIGAAAESGTDPILGETRPSRSNQKAIAAMLKQHENLTREFEALKKASPRLQTRGKIKSKGKGKGGTTTGNRKITCAYPSCGKAHTIDDGPQMKKKRTQLDDNAYKELRKKYINQYFESLKAARAERGTANAVAEVTNTSIEEHTTRRGHGGVFNGNVDDLFERITSLRDQESSTRQLASDVESHAKLSQNIGGSDMGCVASESNTNGSRGQRYAWWREGHNIQTPPQIRRSEYKWHNLAQPPIKDANNYTQCTWVEQKDTERQRMEPVTVPTFIEQRESSHVQANAPPTFEELFGDNEPEMPTQNLDDEFEFPKADTADKIDMHEINNVVWVKSGHYPWWPGVVYSRDKDCLKYVINSFGENSYMEAPYQDIISWNQGLELGLNSDMGKAMRRHAISEAEDYYCFMRRFKAIQAPPANTWIAAEAVDKPAAPTNDFTQQEQEDAETDELIRRLVTESDVNEFFDGINWNDKIEMHVACSDHNACMVTAENTSVTRLSYNMGETSGTESEDEQSMIFEMDCDTPTGTQQSTEASQHNNNSTPVSPVAESPTNTRFIGPLTEADARLPPRLEKGAFPPHGQRYL